MRCRAVAASRHGSSHAPRSHPAHSILTEHTSIRVHSKLKVHNSSTFQGPKLHFSSTKIIDRKPYPRRGHSKLRLQCDNELSCIQVLGSKLSANAKFQNLQDLNSRTFKHLICFQALSRAFKFLFQIQAFSRISQACDESWASVKFKS